MRKTFLIFFLFLFFFGMYIQTNGKKNHKYLKKPEPSQYKAFVEENVQNKRKQFLRLKQQMKKIRKRCSPFFRYVQVDNSLDGEMIILENTVNMQPDLNGDVYITGLCQNVNEPQVVLIFISFEYFGSAMNSLGTTLGMAFGESNVQVVTEDGTLCIDAMHPGEKGFFLAQSTGISYNEVDTYAATFYYGVPVDEPAPLSNTKLSVESIDYQTWRNNNLKAHTTIKNSCPNYASVTTAVLMAVFDTDNLKVIDASAGYAGSTSSPGYSWAIYPLETETVDLYYGFAETGEYGTAFQSAFMFYEGEADSSNDQEAPFGAFDTPVDGSTVNGSIAVTGWALDDYCLKSLKIYRKEGNGMVYLGDANFLEGARPDIETGYPTYPNCSKAGWGYMLLTNFLPNGGNGAYTLYAIATDRTGKSTTLGEKNIVCDNANAVKPFGAIDTPTQGGIAIGENFINFGWVLTPQPDYLKTDGSTIKVYIDGVNRGNPSYNKARTDIATLFPGYANSDGPGGNFIFDTTAYTDGVHTIQWYAVDSGNDSDGIGSRYFNITNGDDEFKNSPLVFSTKQTSLHSTIGLTKIEKLPIAEEEPILIKKGYQENKKGIKSIAQKGFYNIELEEVSRVQINLSDNNSIEEGYQLVGDRLRALPIGSTLDKERGIFYWQPGPGFLKEFYLVFIEKSPDGGRTRKDILITIVPKESSDETYKKN